MVKKFILSLLMLTAITPKSHPMQKMIDGATNNPEIAFLVALGGSYLIGKYAYRIYKGEADLGLASIGQQIDGELEGAFAVSRWYVTGFVIRDQMHPNSTPTTLDKISIGVFLGSGLYCGIKKLYEIIPKKRDQWLINACKKRQHLRAKMLIKAGADVNAIDENDQVPGRVMGEGKRPIHFAVRNQDLQLLEWLIANDADVNAQAAYLFTPLHFAAEEAIVEIGRLLIDNGALVDAKNQMRITPLFWTRSTDFAQLLIEKGADVNSSNTIDNWTPLHNNAVRNLVDILQLLIDNGAQVDVQETHGITPLHYAKAPEAVYVLLLGHISKNPYPEIELPQEQYTINENGEKEIKSLKDLCWIDIISRNNIEEIAQCPADILMRIPLSMEKIRTIIELWNNNQDYSQEFIKETTQELLIQYCQNHDPKIALPQEQYSINENGGKEIKSLKDLCMLDIIARNNIEEVAQCPPDILTRGPLSMEKIRTIIALWNNNQDYSEEFIKETTKELVNQYQLQQIRALVSIRDIQGNTPYDRANNQECKQIFEMVSNAQTLMNLPADLRESIQANALALGI